MQFFSSSIGRKVVMAVTGLMLGCFVLIHLLGNSSVFAGPGGINAYAEKLHSLGPIVWVFRAVMAGLLILHIYFGIQLTLENNRARPAGYMVKKEQKATISSKTMIWSGSIIFCFLIYHLLHFTIQGLDPSIAAKVHFDAAGRPDVYRMMALGFKSLVAVVVYGVSVIALGFHLSHGLHSGVQTLGIAGDRSLPVVVRGALMAALVVVAGYMVIPGAVFMGLLRGF